MHFSCTPNVLQSSRDVKHSFFKPQVFRPYSVTTQKLQTTLLSPVSKWTQNPEITVFKTHLQLQKVSPNSHFNTDKLMDLFNQTEMNAETETTIFTCLEKSARCRRLNAASYSTDSSNKLYSCATQNPNSHCPWSSKRETCGVHRFSCLTSKSKVTDYDVPPCEIPEEF